MTGTAGTIDDHGATGRHDGRANALTLLLPLEPWGAHWLRPFFRWLSLPRQRHRFETIDRLRFIYAIRWSVMEPLVPGGRGPDGKRLLLFESNFSGDWDEYLEVFGAVLGGQLSRIIVACDGYPGLDDLGHFKAWARLHDHTPEHYACAYPTLTPLDIRRRLAEVSGGTSRNQVWREGFGRATPSWSTFLVPIAPGAEDRAIAAARALDDPPPTTDPHAPGVPGRSRLLVDGVHFARVVVVTRASGSWVLMTVTHDGAIGPVLRAMFAVGPRPDGTGALRDLLACTDLGGSPLPTSPAALAALLLAHQPVDDRTTLRYCAYPGWSAPAVAALAHDRRLDQRWPQREGET